MNQPTYPVPQQGGQPAQRNLGQLIANLGPQSKLAAQSTVDPRALAAGIKPSFASISFKGKTWGIRYRGVTQQLLARGAQGEILGAIPTIDVIVVKSATAISKTFYIDKFKEGSFAPPDCWSTNGQVPDIAAAKKQSETCRGCRWDAFGSRTMDDGRKGKACSDSKRIAVVPATDVKNEAYGGPMLLKLPPSSFNGLSELENQLHMQGYAYFAVVMRLNFDHEQAFPKIIFTPVRVLSDEELKEVLALQEVDTVDRILNEELTEVTGDPGQPVPAETSQQQEQPTPAQQPVTTVVSPPSGQQAFVPAAPPLATPSLTPSLTPEQQRIAQLEVQLAEARVAARPPPPPVETPEQKRIRELEEALAAAKAGAPAAVPQAQTEAKPSRKRTKPVMPPQTTQTAQVASQPALAQASAAPAVASQPVASQPVANGEDAAGDAPADLDNRINALLNPPGSPTA